MGRVERAGAERPFVRRLVAWSTHASTPRVAWFALLFACTIAWAWGRTEAGEAVRAPSADGIYYYAYLPSVVLDGDLDFANQYEVTRNRYHLQPTPTGREGNVFGIGPAVFQSPFFVVGHGLALASGSRRDGFSHVELALVGWASVLASMLAVWFAYRVARRRVAAPGTALAAALLVFAGSPVVYYAVRQPGYAHPFATLFIAWLVDRWDASYDRERTVRTWAGLGALLGLAALARPQLALWGVLLVVAGLQDLVAAWRRGDSRRVGKVVGRLAVALVAAIVCFSPQLVAWRVLYGEYYTVPQGEHFMRWDAPAWSEVLFSSRNGLLPWSPLIALCLVGLAVATARQSRLAVVLMVGVAAQVMANGAVWDWWAGGSFGGRRFDSAYVAFVIGLAVVLQAAWRVAVERRDGARPAVARVAVLACPAFLVSAWLAAANLSLVATTSARSVRAEGGRAAAVDLERRLGAFGLLPALASRLSNLPARVVFALRYETGLDAYDRVVGVHWMGETYPGLNSRPPAQRDERRAGDLAGPFRAGFEVVLVPPDDHRALRTASGRGRLLIGLNRLAPVTVSLELATPAAVEVVWNGEVVSSDDVGATVHAVTVSPRRGTNVLELETAPGTVLLRVTLESTSPL